MTPKRTIFSLMIVLLVLLVSGLVAAQGQDLPTGQQAEATPQPETSDPQSSGFIVPQTDAATSETIAALGSVEANTVASLQFQTTGTVQGVYVEVGDYVQAGEVLADLDAQDAWNTYNQAILNLESAQLTMDELLEPPSEADLAVAQANVTSAQAAYSSTANSVTQAQIDNSQMKYDQALAQLQALQDARAHMSGTEEEIALQEAQIGAASFDAEIARLQLEELQTPDSSSLWSASLRIQQAQLQLEQLQAPAAQAEIDSVQLSIDRAQASVLDAQTALQQIQLVTPISGYVTTVSVAAGQTVGQGTVVIEISDTSQLRMTVPVNELDIGKVNEGMSAVIQLDALSDTDIPGTVEHVGWVAETSSDGIVTYDVQVLLNTDNADVRIGMTGEVTIEAGSLES